MRRGRFEAHTRPPTSSIGAGSPLTKTVASKIVFLSCDETVGLASAGCGDAVGAADVDWCAQLLRRPHGAGRAGPVWQGEDFEVEHVAAGLMVQGAEAHSYKGEDPMAMRLRPWQRRYQICSH